MDSIFKRNFTPFVDKKPMLSGGRRLLGTIPCLTCQKPARVFMGDSRSRGWTRMECPAGHWADIGPESIYLKELKR